MPDTNSTELVMLPFENFMGSTGLFFRILGPGIILKAPVKMGFDQIISGPYTEFPTGLLFAEASHGSLQNFLYEHTSEITPSLRQKWFVQAIESIEFIHSKGVVHSDLRPDNFLVDCSLSQSLDLRLCDFGGSTCEDLQLSGGTLPDSGFHNPNDAWEPTYVADIFSLGSVLYTIMTGHWPFRPTTGEWTSTEEMMEYNAKVDRCFADGIFPEVEGLFGGEIIMGCWTNKLSTAAEIMAKVSQLVIKN
ncbi:hypothetical protein M431DRAFT_3633 [Trichoderma harzianum CBS 226.95]|uniref:EKC/KEOPS complex subunit BUD32 n=1 Tax=Trichoderma harzianum CBS 226.95 TaxID=983964 RepID=A0A2T4AHD4_TRIHA|nr:hypothetical protein M431DRAFT_3633 [Trichoderma harzianum CBS 226.95]PTB56467.1 hypothetical protein M431DRAFT_3633 [Trichoderma harzianum CBS 226.95]